MTQQTAADECCPLFVILKVSWSSSEPPGMKKNLSLFIRKYFDYGQKLTNLDAVVLNTQYLDS